MKEKNIQDLKRELKELLDKYNVYLQIQSEAGSLAGIADDQIAIVDASNYETLFSAEDGILGSYDL